VTDVALARLELDDLLAELLVRVRDILDVDTCAVLMLDPDANDLVVRAGIGLDEDVREGARIPVGEGVAGRVAASQSPVVVDGVLGVPLVVEGEVLGVLYAGSARHRGFHETDTHVLQLVADRAALAIEHARAFAAERKARRRLEDLQAVTDAALARLGLEELLAELLPRIKTILSVDTVAVLLLQPGEDELLATGAVGLEEEVEQGVRIPLGRGFAGRVAAEKRPVILPDVDHADVLNPILREKGIKTLLGVPLIVHDDAIGTLHVGSLVHREFTTDEVELLELVADRLAMAIERARLHEEALRLDALKLNFVAVASHELRTPATSVYGIAMTLRERRDTLPPELREQLETTLWEQSIRLRRLIEQLLDLSRLDTENVKLEPRPLVVQHVLSEIARSVGAAEDVETAVDADPDLAVVADPLVIERVVTNMVLNAHRYGRPPVTLSARQSDTHLRIAVDDEGEGISDELQARLFDRFERGVHGGEGSGLGLAIAKAYARAHGGDVVYEPRDRGARFELLLPLGFRG
jgi:signal transduction histidine kinase